MLKTDREVREVLLKFVDHIPDFIDLEKENHEWEFFKYMNFPAWAEADLYLGDDNFHKLYKYFAYFFKNEIQGEDTPIAKYNRKLNMTRAIALMACILDENQDKWFKKCLFLAYNIWKYNCISKDYYQDRLNRSIQELPLQVRPKEGFDIKKLNRIAGRRGFRLELKNGCIFPILKDPSHREKFVEKVVLYKKAAYNELTPENPFVNQMERYFLTIPKDLRSWTKFTYYYNSLYDNLRGDFYKNLLEKKDEYLFIPYEFNVFFVEYRNKLVDMFFSFYQHHKDNLLDFALVGRKSFGGFRKGNRNYDLQDYLFLIGDRLYVYGHFGRADDPDIEVNYEGHVRVKYQDQQIVDFEKEDDFTVSGSIFAFEDLHQENLKSIQERYSLCEEVVRP